MDGTECGESSYASHFQPIWVAEVVDRQEMDHSSHPPSDPPIYSSRARSGMLNVSDGQNIRY